MATFQTTQARVPPHSQEAEESVLGAMLIDKDAVIAVAEFLSPTDFYDERLRDVYESCLDLYEERTPIDVLTVSERLKSKKLLKNVGGSALLADLANRVPTAAHVEHYGRIVKDLATKRFLMSAATKLVEVSMDAGVGAGEALDKAESEIFALSSKSLGSKAFISVKDTLAGSFDRLDELHKSGAGIRGVPTGFKDIDDALAGMQKSNLLILAARPGVGKTSLAMNIAQFIAVELKRPVGFFSLEMSKEELVDRLLVAQADIDAWKLKTGKLSEDDFTKLSNAMGELAEAPLFIDDTPALSVLEMRTKARRLQVESGLDFLVVDYLQLARSRNLENRVQEVSEISQGMKNLARELKIPVMVLSQLSRAVEARGGKKPQLSDLRESGCLIGSSNVYLYDEGKSEQIKNLVGKKNFYVLAMNDDLKLTKAKVLKVFPSGRKTVYKLTLKSGKYIEASGNHPFFRLDGWTRLDKFKTGEKIAIPRNIDSNTKNISLSDNKLIVLAHLIGDGCYVKSQPLHYTNSDMKLINIVKNAASMEFGIKPRIVKQNNWYHLYLSAPEKLARGRRNPIVKWLDEELGIYGQRSRIKVIPEPIFELPNVKIAFFLKHLWSTDGCIFIQNSQKSKVSIYYATGSKIMAHQVSHLLLRLGIISTITVSKKAGYEDIWNVRIQSKPEQLKFIKIVGSVGEKVKAIIEAKKFLAGIKENPNNDIIPKEIWNYIEALRKQKGLSARDFHSKMGWAYSGTQRFGNGIGRDRLAKINRILKDKHLANLATSDIYWDEIKTIEKIGVREVYDMTVDKHPNFVVNDILVHNSIEQDADVVMFLWREDDENQENMMLDIAKHRNGPLRNIPLHFKGDRIRFFARDMKHKQNG